LAAIFIATDYSNLRTVSGECLGHGSAKNPCAAKHNSDFI
jgi:hypothetical protein